MQVSGFFYCPISSNNHSLGHNNQFSIFQTFQPIIMARVLLKIKNAMNVEFRFPNNQVVRALLNIVPAQGDRVTFKGIKNIEDRLYDDVRAKEWAVSSVLWNVEDGGITSVIISVSEVGGISN
jgi:hypothetical protein